MCPSVLFYFLLAPLFMRFTFFPCTYISSVIFFHLILKHVLHFSCVCLWSVLPCVLVLTSPHLLSYFLHLCTSIFYSFCSYLHMPFFPSSPSFFAIFSMLLYLPFFLVNPSLHPFSDSFPCFIFKACPLWKCLPTLHCNLDLFLFKNEH